MNHYICSKVFYDRAMIFCNYAFILNFDYKFRFNRRYVLNPIHY